MKRIIGGAIFVVGFYAAILSDLLFPFLIGFLIIFSLIEWANIMQKTNNKLLGYGYYALILLFIISLYFLKFANPAFLIYVTGLTMANDTCAYFVGKYFGKHKLTKISPKKTVEGALGGMILAPILTVAMLGFFQMMNLGQVGIFDFTYVNNYNPFTSQITLYAVSLILVVLAIFGDLFESYLKRSAKIKDSGYIVYGHGGILDRTDSWVFVTIVAAIIMQGMQF